MSLTTADFDYDLPQERIAQTPLEPRDSSRLLVMDRRGQSLEHAYFRDLGRYLRPGDILVLNQTRVIPARLYARKLPGGGRVEVLLLQREDDLTWEALVGGKGLKEGRRIQLENVPEIDLQAEIVQVLSGARRRLRFERPIDDLLTSAGHVPLPPYIHTPLADPERYQTVYARRPGSAAAPTAGLHFTPQLMSALQSQGVAFANVTLHVGLDTFAPVTEETPQEHQIHSEWCQVPVETVAAIHRARCLGGRVIAVGTTSVRTLESAMQSGDLLPYEGATSLYILPGYSFRLVDAMITNFHLPRSTLIMLVSAFAGRESTLQAYRTAIQEGYRFYSFGDAMLIS